MLKKLLASALAVATVASCAYVPSALASAATTYKTATAVDYMDWALKQAAAPSTEVTVKIHVSTNTTGTDVYSFKAEPADVTKEYVAEKLNGAKNAAGVELKNVIGEIKDTDNAIKYELTYLEPAGTNTYVAVVTKKRAVVYSTYDETATTVAKVDADTLGDLKLLGYYDYNDSQKATVLATLTDVKYTSQAKVATQEFSYWKYQAKTDVNTDESATLVTPVFNDVVAGAGTAIYNYTEVKLVRAYNGGIQNLGTKVSSGALTTGTYANIANAAYDEEAGAAYDAAAAGDGSILLPNSDKANWNLYLVNYAKVAGYVTTTATYKDDNTTKIDDYEWSGNVRFVKAKKAGEVALDTYALTYVKKSAGGDKVVNYSLTLVDADGHTVTAGGKDAEFTGSKSFDKWENAEYPTDAETLYTIAKKSDPADADADKDTLADWLVRDKDDHLTIYKLTNNYVVNTVDKTGPAHEVTVEIEVTPLEEYTVYSFGPEDSVAETSVYLTEAQADNTAKYLNQDGTTELSDEKVANVSRDVLGVAQDATIEGVPATYAYAKTDMAAHVIECTYKMGDATVALSDFQTATGAFKSQPYFGRDAKVGDQVTLKVSLAETGVAKKLDLTKLEVAYSVVGATVAKTNYDYTATEFPAGEAIDITLGQGTNIVTATVSYNGVKIGTFEPFYAYVAE